MNFQVLRNSFIAGSLGVSFTGFIALFTPYQQFSQFLISSGLGSLAASNLAIQSSQNISNRKRGKLLAEIESLRNDTNHFSNLLQEKHQVLIQADDDIDELREALDTAKEFNLSLTGIIDRKNEELEATKKLLNDTQSINFETAVTILRESLQEVKSQVNALIPYLIKKFDVDVSTLLAEFNQDCTSLSKQIGVISDNSK